MDPRLLWLLVAFLLAPLAAAETTEFDVQAQLYVDGKLVASPHLLAVPGEPAEISQMTDTSKDRLRVRFVASDDSHQFDNGIFLKFDIYYRKGKKIVESMPEVMAKPGEVKEIKIGKKDDPKTELKIRAVRL